MAGLGQPTDHGAGVAGMMDNSTCLLVIPSYRDAVRLRPFLNDLMTRLPAEFFVKVVDDGSGERGAAALEHLIREARANPPIPNGAQLLEPLMLSKNAGKGAAVYSGWRYGPETGLVAFVDADGAVSATEILRIWNAWPDLDADAVIASRVKMLGRNVQRISSRHYAGRVFATMASVLTGLDVYDSQCGFKLIRREAFVAADRLGLEASRFAFDVELLVALARSNCRMVEFPVDWKDVAGGSVSLVRHSLPMINELLKIRFRHGRLKS